MSMIWMWYERTLNQYTTTSLPVLTSNMIPRFSNPHFLLQSTMAITRADLDAEDEENSKDCLKEDSKTIEQLHRLLGNSLPKWDVSNIRSNNRMKIEENDQVEEEPVRMCSFTL